jgi:hypothetical protein
MHGVWVDVEQKFAGVAVCCAYLDGLEHSRFSGCTANVKKWILFAYYTSV